jgi:uncharacterized protein
MISSYTGGPAEEVIFDMDVQLVFDKISDEITLPRFRRA